MKSAYEMQPQATNGKWCCNSIQKCVFVTAFVISIRYRSMLWLFDADLMSSLIKQFPLADSKLGRWYSRYLKKKQKKKKKKKNGRIFQFRV